MIDLICYGIEFLLNWHFMKQCFNTIGSKVAREVTRDSMVAQRSGEQTAPDRPQGAHVSNSLLMHMQELYFIKAILSTHLEHAWLQLPSSL